jgi:hypothetical protein
MGELKDEFSDQLAKLSWMIRPIAALRQGASEMQN